MSEFRENSCLFHLAQWLDATNCSTKKRSAFNENPGSKSYKSLWGKSPIYGIQCENTIRPETLFLDVAMDVMPTKWESKQELIISTYIKKYIYIYTYMYMIQISKYR